MSTAPLAKSTPHRHIGATALSLVCLALVCLAFAGALAPGVALAGAGDPDPSFGSDGLFVHDFAGEGPDSGSELRAVSLAGGGDVDVAGVRDESDEREVLVARLNEAGALDPSFGSGGYFITPFIPRTQGVITLRAADSELVQDDGAILAGGARILGRLTSTGQVDSSFQDERDHIYINTIASLPGGDVLTAGYQEGSSPNESEPAAIEALLENGEPDQSFGSDGVVMLPMHPGTKTQEQIRSVIPLESGQLLLGGAGGSVNNEKSEDFAWVARLNSDGSLDHSFGGGGVDYVPSASSTEAALVREPDGVLALLGDGRTETPGPWEETHGWQVQAWGFTEQGAADAGFGEDGVTRVPGSDPELSSFVSAATTDAQGRIFLVANQVKLSDYTAAPFVARLTAGGQLDSSYGSDGYALGPEAASFNAITVDSQGRAIVAGYGDGGSLVERFQGEAQGSPGQQAQGGSQSIAAGSNGKSAGASTSPSTQTAPSTSPDTQMAQLLARESVPRGGAARIAKRIKRGVYRFAFKVPGPGRAVVEWFYRRELVASGNVGFAKAGKVTITIRLTAAGRRLEESSKVLKLVAKSTYTAQGSQPTRALTIFEGEL